MRKSGRFMICFTMCIVVFIITAFLPESIGKVRYILGGIAMFLFPIFIIAALVAAIRETREIKAKRKAAEEAVPAPQPEAPRPSYHFEPLKVAGTSFYQDGIRSIGHPNDDYSLTKRALLEDFEGDRVYELDFYPMVKFVPEPDNEYDANAIRVEADGVLIGHVPKGKNKYIREMMDCGRILDINAEIEGGKYKLAEDDELEKGETDFFVKLTLKIKDEENKEVSA